MNRGDKKLDQVFTALSNKHRRNVVYRLSLQPASIVELAKQEKLSLPAIHKHIRILEQANLIARKKHGRSNFLALDRTALQKMQSWIAQFHSYWGAQGETLENYIFAIEKRSKKIK